MKKILLFCVFILGIYVLKADIRYPNGEFKAKLVNNNADWREKSELQGKNRSSILNFDSLTSDFNDISPLCMPYQVDIYIDQNACQICFSSLDANGNNYGNYYNWDFGNGQTSNDPNPCISYNTNGTYEVSLQISSSAGVLSYCDGFGTVTVEITDAYQILINPVQNCNQVSFIADIWGCSSNLTNLSYLWDFGNGVYSTDVSPTFTYSSVGTYLASLTTTDVNGISNTEYVYIDITDVNSADILPTINCSQVSFSADALGCITWNNDMTYSWDFGNGQTSTSPTPTINYTALGTYPVTLTVIGNGSVISDTINVNIVSQNSANILPTINCNKVFFSPVLSGCILSSGSSPTANITYTWDFGNGLSSNVPYPTVTYAESGTYTVTLTATGNGTSVTKSVPILVTKCN